MIFPEDAASATKRYLKNTHSTKKMTATSIHASELINDVARYEAAFEILRGLVFHANLELQKMRMTLASLQRASGGGSDKSIEDFKRQIDLCAKQVQVMRKQLADAEKKK